MHVIFVILIYLHFISVIEFMFVYFLCISTLDDSGCDVNLTVTDIKQFFATEGYPHNYKDNQDCQLNFEAPSGRNIVVFFQDFHLQDRHDFLHFRKFYTLKTQMHKTGLNIQILKHWKHNLVRLSFCAYLHSMWMIPGSIGYIILCKTSLKDRYQDAVCPL